MEALLQTRVKTLDLLYFRLEVTGIEWTSATHVSLILLHHPEQLMKETVMFFFFFQGSSPSEEKDSHTNYICWNWNVFCLKMIFVYNWIPI